LPGKNGWRCKSANTNWGNFAGQKIMTLFLEMRNGVFALAGSDRKIAHEGSPKTGYWRLI
jgi:hypothetical protein